MLEEEAADLRVTVQGGDVEGRDAQCSEVGSQHWERRPQNRRRSEGIATKVISATISRRITN